MKKEEFVEKEKRKRHAEHMSAKEDTCGLSGGAQRSTAPVEGEHKRATVLFNC